MLENQVVRHYRWYKDENNMYGFYYDSEVEWLIVVNTLVLHKYNVHKARLISRVLYSIEFMSKQPHRLDNINSGRSCISVQVSGYR